MTQAGSMISLQSDLFKYRQRLSQLSQEERLGEYEWIARNPKEATRLQSAALMTEVMEGDDRAFFERVLPMVKAGAEGAWVQEWRALRRQYLRQKPIRLGYLGWKLMFAGTGALVFLLYSLLMSGAI